MRNLVALIVMAPLLLAAAAAPAQTASGPQICGGIAGLKCDASLYCDYPIEAQCGAADQTGICRKKPQICTMQYDPVCGCDGNNYSNACAAASAGISVAHKGQCKSGTK